MVKCTQLIAENNKIIYLPYEDFDSLIEFANLMDYTLNRGTIPDTDRIKIKNLKNINALLNNRRYNEPQIRFVPETIKEKEVNKDNYERHNDRAKEVQLLMEKILMNGEKLNLSKLIDKFNSKIGLSRNAWTNHLRKTLNKLTSSGYKVIKEGVFYSLNRKVQK